MTQQEALDLMLEGKSVFLTGEPGAGKTYTLNKFIDQARALSKRVAITASTGIAASHIDGQTIHSWSSLGVRDGDSIIKDHELDKMGWKPYVADKYRRCDILIIDEISMLHDYYLDMVERACRMIRQIEKPFGGLQVILVGDLFQLPPVSRDGEKHYAHESEAWKSADLEVCYLTEQHRQGADDELLDILRAMRADGLTQHHKTLLNHRINRTDDESVTRLYTHNADVDALNHRRLVALNKRQRSFRMEWSGDNYRVNAMKRGILAPETLYLSEGAEVMFVANNFEEGYVNGTRGRVVGFGSSGDPLVETQDGARIYVEENTWRAYDEQGQVEVASVTQYPLRLAWAVTIHKSQGMSLDEAEIDLSKAFAPGMGYVALSRVRSLDGLYLVGLGAGAFSMDEDIRQFDKLLKQGRSK